MIRLSWLAPTDRSDANGPGDSAPESSISATVHRWGSPSGSLELRVGKDEKEFRSLRLEDGTLFVFGRVFELVEAFTPKMERVGELDSLGERTTVAEAVSRLERANGRYLALVVRHGPAPAAVEEPRATVLANWSNFRALFYGSTTGRIEVATEAHTVSDGLGLGRDLDGDRFVDVCVMRLLCDEGTLLRGVSRLRAGDRLELAGGSLRVRPVDRTIFAMEGLPEDPDGDGLHLALGRSLIRRAVEIRSREAGDLPVTLLTSSGLDSRVLMAVAREVGVTELTGVSIGSKRGYDESAVAAEWARGLGYTCHPFYEEDLDLRGSLEPYVEALGFPPKFYNHLLIGAALRELGQPGGSLWSGDHGAVETLGTPVRLHLLRRRHRWLPGPALFRALLPLRPLLPAQPKELIWLFSMEQPDAAIVGLGPERSPEDGRSLMALLGRRTSLFDPAPHRTPSIESALERVGRPFRWEDYRWLRNDAFFSSMFPSRVALALDIGARFDAPLDDPSLLAFGVSALSRLPEEYLHAKAWKNLAFEAWLPRKHWVGKKRLIGGLADWFRDPLKLGEYVDLVASRECLERGLFQRAALRRLVDRAQSLTQAEGRQLWTVLCMELLFRRGLVTVS